MVRESQPIILESGLYQSHVILLLCFSSGYTSASKVSSSGIKKMTENEKDSFVNSLLKIVLTDTMLRSPIEDISAGCVDTKPYNSSKNSEYSDDITNKNNNESSSGKSIVSSLDQLYERFHSPFNPCIQPISGGASGDDGGGGGALWLKCNVLVVRNSLRIIAAAAAFSGPDFVAFLSLVMCSLLEKCGDKNLLIAHTARWVS